jgi:hypothetical protein
VEASASVWCFASPDDRAWWGELWADRMTQSSIASQLVGAGLASPETLSDIAAAFRIWAEDPDGWFLVPHGEAIARA